MNIIRNRHHPWRHHLDQEKWRRQYRRRCLFLCLCLAAELSCFSVRNALRTGILSIHLIRKEEQIDVELITREKQKEYEKRNPGLGNQDGRNHENGEYNEERPEAENYETGNYETGNNEEGEIYGIRFHPDTWEIQFYRRVKEDTP